MLRPPKPRLRQVFEHTTSFKVTGPSGKQITIAKKGLSPSTVGRLRRFAQGGEVRGYDDGGEVTEPVNEPLAEMPQIAPEVLTPQAAAPVTEEAAPVQPRRVVTQAMLDEEARRQAAASAAPPVAALTPVAPTAPTAPVVVNVTTAPQPVAPQPAPQKMEAVPKAGAAAKQTASNDDISATAPAAEAPIEEEFAPKASDDIGLTPEEQQFLFETGVGSQKPAPEKVRRAEVAYLNTRPKLQIDAYLEGKQQGMTPEQAANYSITQMQKLKASKSKPPLAAAATPPAPVTTADAAPTAATPAAPSPATVPAAAAEPRPPVAPPAAPPVAVPAPNVGAALQAPTRLFASVPRAAPAPAAAVAPSRIDDLMTDAEIDAATESLPDFMRDAVRLTMRAQRDERAAIMREEQVNRQQLAEQAKQAQEEQRAALNKIEQIQATRNNLLAQVKEAREEGDLASRMPWYQKIGTVLALAVSGFAAGYTGTPNYALAAFDKQLERDLERQKRRQDSLFSELKAVTGSEDLAVDMYKSIAKEMVAIKAQEASMLATSDRSRAAYAKLSAEFLLDARKSAADIELKAAQTESALASAAGMLTAEEKISLELAKKAERDARLELEKRRLALAMRKAEKDGEDSPELAFRKARFDQETALNIADETLRIRSPTGARDISEQIARRTSAYRAAQKLADMLKSTPLDQMANVFSGERGQAIAELALLTERVPEGFGYKRAISLNAGKVVKEALQKPESAKSLILDFMSKNNGRKIWQGVQGIADEFTEARTEYISSNVRADQEGRASRDAVLKALKQKDEEYLKAQAKPSFGFVPAGGK